MLQKPKHLLNNTNIGFFIMSYLQLKAFLLSMMEIWNAREEKGQAENDSEDAVEPRASEQTSFL